MSLPVPNLDDRTFQDIVDEAKRLIPTLLPGVDEPQPDRSRRRAHRAVRVDDRDVAVPPQPGARQVLHAHAEHDRASSRSRRRRRAPTSRSGSSTSSTSRSSCPPAPQVSTAGEIGAPGVFTTLDDLVITQPQLMASLVSPGPDAYVDVWDALRLANQAVIVLPPRRRRRPATASTSASSDSLAGNAIRMTIAANVEGIGVIPDQAAAALGGLAGRGLDPGHRVPRHDRRAQPRRRRSRCSCPPAHEPLTLGGQRAFWMRARVLEPEPGQPTYRASPQIRQIRVDSIGGSVTAEHSERGAAVRSSARAPARPTSVFTTRQHAGAAAAATARSVEVDRRQTSTTEWDGGRRLRRQRPRRPPLRVELDDRRGPLRPAHPLPRRHHPPARGDPPRGRRRSSSPATAPAVARPATSARPRSIDMRTSLPYVDRVENIAPAIGGVDAETVDNAKRRGPHSLRAGGRAVTVEDFERLASEADPAIARVRCLPPEISRASRSGCCSSRTIERPGELLELDDFALTDDMVTRVSDAPRRATHPRHDDRDRHAVLPGRHHRRAR